MYVGTISWYIMGEEAKCIHSPKTKRTRTRKFGILKNNYITIEGDVDSFLWRVVTLYIQVCLFHTKRWCQVRVLINALETLIINIDVPTISKTLNIELSLIFIRPSYCVQKYIFIFG